MNAEDHCAMAARSPSWGGASLPCRGNSIQNILCVLFVLSSLTKALSRRIMRNPIAMLASLNSLARKSALKWQKHKNGLIVGCTP
eukprot:m.45939 g.45939  ORF g.45939 m.45939 type:complete len:85 (+) comp33647_c0_seq3:1684-1938(+)